MVVVLPARIVAPLGAATAFGTFDSFTTLRTKEYGRVSLLGGHGGLNEYGCVCDDCIGDDHRTSSLSASG